MCISTVKHGFSIMFWGCFSYNGTGITKPVEKTLNSSQYIAILESCLEVSAEKIENPLSNLIFMKDNAPCHVSKMMKEYFCKQNYTVMDWPPQSPDLNPIENLWSIVKYRLSKLEIAKKEDLIKNFMSEWKKLEDNQICKNLVDSMPKRVKEVIKNKGGAINY